MRGLDPYQFRAGTIAPALAMLGMYGIPVAQFPGDLLMATAAQETLLGRLPLRQVDGDAISLYQFEPSTLDGLVGYAGRNFPEVLAVITTPGRAPGAQVITDLRYATVMARLYYWRSPLAMPLETTLLDLWRIYKTVWNTAAGKATLAEFTRNLKLTDIRLSA